MRLASGERAALCDRFERTGPDAPTVLPGWRAADLLAHLLVRERQPLASPGILIGPLSGSPRPPCGPTSTHRTAAAVRWVLMRAPD
ncbi:MAG: maleylpyruvate isomerase N-terminal domain-containing protein [Pseudonocardiales bacterium]|nr:maleylpyruvate isomerase N-terminal domain-containing protein [Pseudonocardiales bacterium]